MLPENGIVTNGAGNYAGFVHRYTQYKGYRSQLAPTSGSMGYGLPAAIAAKLADPDAHGRELRRRRLLHDDRPGAGDRRAVRAQRRDDHRQQRHVRHDPHAPGEDVSGPRRRHARSSIRTSPPTRGRSAPTARRWSGPRTSSPRSSARSTASKPAIIECRIDPEALTPRQTLSQIRQAGGKKLAAPSAGNCARPVPCVGRAACVVRAHLAADPARRWRPASS